MDNGYINFLESDLNKPIYRIFTIQRLLEVFSENSLILVRPSKWDDPFENYLMKATGEKANGQRFSIGSQNHFYGQCWTTQIESDALWRIYAPEKNGVKVKTTPKKLLSALLTQNPQTNNINLTCFIGKVEYKDTINLKKLLSNLPDSLKKDQSGQQQAKTLLLKRTPFSHEKEVRLIYNSLGKFDGDLYKFLIKPNELFEHIVFDPRMDDLMYNLFKKHLLEIGFKKEIIKSGLYKEQKFTFKSKD